MSPKKLPPRPPIFPFIPADTDSLQIRVTQLEQNRFLNQHSDQPHAHHFPEIIYCEQSGGFHRLGTQQKDVKTGDLFLIAPYELHDANELTAKRWVLQFTINAFAASGSPITAAEFSSSTVPSPSSSSLLSWFSNPLLMPFARPSNGRSGYVNIEHQERLTLIQHLQALEAELQLRQLGYREAARGYLTLILVKIARLTANGNPPFQEHPLLVQVFRIIEARYSEPISSADVARAVNKSPSYLTTFVRRLTGRTIMEWISEWRIAEARRLLLQTNENLATICERVGYRDTSGFIRLFRRVYGVTPSEWRRANR